MSRVGNKIINVPEGVIVSTSGNVFSVSGPKGSQEFQIPEGVSAEIHDRQISVKRSSNTKGQRSLHGTSARIITNIITGLTEGFSRKLDYKGVGFTVNVEDNKLSMRLGYSHPIVLEIPEDLTVSVVKNTIIVEGSDKEKVGLFAAKIRDTKKPEVYKGKGIKYHEEIIKKKAGKAAQTASS